MSNKENSSTIEESRNLTARFSVPFQFQIAFTRQVFNKDNPTLVKALKNAGDKVHRILPVIDSNVLAHFPSIKSDIASYFRHNHADISLIDEPLTIRGGEICKKDPKEVDEIYQLTVHKKIDRHSFILAIGGGAVLDAVGYAAATAHRGIRLIRLPTTVLAQNDAGIGVKNAVNYAGRKNYLGTFAAPFAVINDFSFLSTLQARDLRCGIAEAIKVALIRSSSFFSWLHQNRVELGQFKDDCMAYMIEECARLHLEHITGSGDPFEMGSARPLDFGHWCAHRLEEISARSPDAENSELRHGEAVAIGIAMDSLYSFYSGRIGKDDVRNILDTLLCIGFKLNHSALDNLDIHSALEAFREHLGGELCITLLNNIGEGIEVNNIDENLMQQCVDQLKTESFSDIDLGLS